MTQYNRLNAELLNSRLNKLKSAIKNGIDGIDGIDAILMLSLNMIGKSDNETNFPKSYY